MTIQRARTPEEYADWVQQAKFEVADLRACLMYDMEELAEGGRFPAFLESLEQSIDAIYQAMCKGEYAFGREDLPFIEILDRHYEQIPFYVLLKQINETHRFGLDVREE
jgi:hypothetical protein